MLLNMNAHQCHAVVCEDVLSSSVKTFSDFLESPRVLKCSLNAIYCMNEGGAKRTYRAFLTLRNGQTLTYQPGDSFALYPQNSETDVNWILEILSNKIHPDQVIILKHKSEIKKTHFRALPVDQHITPRILISDFLELHSLASRKTAKILADCCQNEDEKAILLKMSGKDGSQIYNKLIRDTNATVMDLLNTFESCHPDLETLLEVCAPLSARPYSLIGKSVNELPQKLNFAFSMIDFTQESPVSIQGVTFNRYQRQTGVATGYLTRIWEEQSSNAEVFISLHQNLNNFSHPESAEEPLILICAGTGLAPFVGFLQHRLGLKENGQSIGETWLIFGCRDPNFDLLFAEELNEFLEKGVITHLCLCFSRYSGDLPANILQSIREKAIVPPGCKYVQDCIASDHPFDLKGVQISLRLTELLCEKGAHVRVCGDAKGMASGVASALTDLVSSWMQRSTAKESQDEVVDPTKAATAYLLQLRKSKRYIEDVWR